MAYNSSAKKVILFGGIMGPRGMIQFAGEMDNEIWIQVADIGAL